MKRAVIALTKNGSILGEKLGQAIDADIFVKYSSGIGTVFKEKLSELIPRIYKNYDSFVMIMATGIVFRTFAPYIESKDIDPAIVVLDEKGQFAISLLSGHLGGANDLTLEIADKINATPVITTATDVNQTLAFDVIAKRNQCVIENLREIQHISSALVNGESVSLYCPYPFTGEVPNAITDYQEDPKGRVVVISNKIIPFSEDNVLYLRPKNLILGVGCRKNTPFDIIEAGFCEFMETHGYASLSIKAMASIDLKKEENGLLELKNKLKIPFLTFSSEELNVFSKDEDGSSFVKSVTGTASVAQSAALAGSDKGTTIVKKTICRGVTFSLAEEPTEIRISV